MDTEQVAHWFFDFFGPKGTLDAPEQEVLVSQPCPWYLPAYIKVKIYDSSN